MIEDQLIGAVNGRCPMGCGYTEPTLDTTLALTEGGDIVCLAPQCPQPRAIAAMLRDGETAHIVVMDLFNYKLKHPLSERVHDQLFECAASNYLDELPGPPVRPGTYRMYPDDEGEWMWELLTE